MNKYNQTERVYKVRTENVKKASKMLLQMPGIGSYVRQGNQIKVGRIVRA